MFLTTSAADFLRAPTLIDGPCSAAAELTPASHRLIEFKVQAGFPSPAADYAEASLDLNEYLVLNKAATYFFTVAGFSMINAGILDGDKVSVNRAIQPKHKHIVVAVVNQEYTIKRLFKQRDRIELHAANPDFPPIRFTDGEELLIWGVVTGVVRKLTV